MSTCSCLDQINVFTNQPETTHANTCPITKKPKPRRRTVRHRAHPAER